MSKFSILLLTFIFSSMCFAGSHGGGMESVAPGSLVFQTQKVFLVGEQGGIVTYRNVKIIQTDNESISYQGQIQITREELQKNEALRNALDTSSVVGWWVDVKLSEF